MPLPSLGAEHAFRATSGLITSSSVGTEAHMREAAGIRLQKVLLTAFLTDISEGEIPPLFLLTRLTFTT